MPKQAVDALQLLAQLVRKLPNRQGFVTFVAGS
jgi:hypothetical protein